MLRARNLNFARLSQLGIDCSRRDQASAFPDLRPKADRPQLAKPCRNDFFLEEPVHHPYVDVMNAIGTRVDETGTLLREAGGFVLRRDLGGRWKLDLHRVPVDHIEKRVRITGTIVGDDLVDVDGVSPDVLIPTEGGARQTPIEAH